MVLITLLNSKSLFNLLCSLLVTQQSLMEAGYKGTAVVCLSVIKLMFCILEAIKHEWCQWLVSIEEMGFHWANRYKAFSVAAFILPPFTQSSSQIGLSGSPGVNPWIWRQHKAHSEPNANSNINLRGLLPDLCKWMNRNQVQCGKDSSPHTSFYWMDKESHLWL